MADPNIEVVPANEDAEVDKILADDLAAIKAEQTPAVPVEQPKPEVPKTETPSEEVPKVEPASPAPKTDAPADDPQKDVIEAFKAPVKGKFESDESYEKRKELANLVAQKKATRSDEEKARLSGEISSTRKELRTLNGKPNESIITPPNNDGGAKPELTPEQKATEDAKKADLARLKELGGATKEEVQEIIRQENFAKDVKSTVDSFVQKHPEFQDPDVQEVFIDFVESNYNWAGKSGKELLTVLELARENMFKPSESIQERVLNGANVQEKVNAMQFPGGTIVRPGIPAEKVESVKELMATGMSEEKAMELLSD